MNNFKMNCMSVNHKLPSVPAYKWLLLRSLVALFVCLCVDSSSKTCLFQFAKRADNLDAQQVIIQPGHVICTEAKVEHTLNLGEISGALIMWGF